MAYNKVVYGGNTLIDLTDLDVTAGDVLSGVTVILADGTKAVGTLSVLQNLKDGSATGSVRGVGTTAESSSYTLGNYAFAEGYDAKASGFASHAQNVGTIAKAPYQTAIGEYNVQDNNMEYALIIGNGTADNARSNALTVDWNGIVSSSNSFSYGTCSDTASTVAKTVTVNDSFTLVTGATVAVKFSNTNTATTPTLNVNNTGAKEIKRCGTTASGNTAYTSWNSGEVVPMLYDGTYWQIMYNMAQNNFVTQSHSVSSVNYNMLLSPQTTATGTTNQTYHSNKIKGNPSTGRVTTEDMTSQEVDDFVDSLDATAIHAVDYIVEQGTSDGWTYHKWNSGLAECWYRGNLGSITLSITLGTTHIVSNAVRLTFPITFTSIPSCVIGYEGNGTGYADIQYINSTFTSTTQSYAVRLARMGQSSITLTNNYFTCHVVGRWK